MTIDHLRIQWGLAFVFAAAAMFAACSSSSNGNDGAQSAGGSGGTSRADGSTGRVDSGSGGSPANTGDSTVIPGGSGGSSAGIDASVAGRLDSAASSGGATTGIDGSAVSSGGSGGSSVRVDAADTSVGSPALDGGGVTVSGGVTGSGGGAGSTGTGGTGGAGGAAGATTCTPTALTDTVFGHSDQVGNYLAADGTNVYWADLLTGNTTARLNRVPVAGGSAVTMAYEEGIADAGFYNLLAVDSTNVYFNPYDILATIGYGGSGSVLWAISKAAGSAPQTGGTAMCYSGWSSNGNTTCPSTQYGGTLLTTGGLQASGKYDGTHRSGFGLISTGSEVCYVDGNQTELRCVPVAGGDPVTLAKVSPDFYPAPIATDGTNVFYRYTDGTLVNMLTSVDIMSVPVAGGTPVKVGSYGSNGGIGGFFLVNAGYLYWAPTTATGQDTIMKMPTTGGTPVVLASNQTVYMSTYAATDGKNLYWWGQDTDSPRQIMKVSVNGGAPTVVVKDGTENIQVLSVAVDDTSVYWMHPPYMYKCPK